MADWGVIDFLKLFEGVGVIWVVAEGFHCETDHAGDCITTHCSPRTRHCELPPNSPGVSRAETGGDSLSTWNGASMLVGSLI